MSDKLTLRQFLDNQPHGEVLAIKNKLIKVLGLSKNSLNGYIYATQNVPLKRRAVINKVLNTDIDFDSAAKEALKKQRKRITKKLATA